MAGKKGCSGGPRKNSGGARPGAGRKPKGPVLSDSLALLTTDPERFLTAVMNDAESDMKLRVNAAKALLPYKHVKKGSGGKREEKKGAGQEAAAGRFGPAAPPRLVINNG